MLSTDAPSATSSVLRTIGVCVGFALLINGASGARAAEPQAQPPTTPGAAGQRALLDQYCVTCHNERMRTGGLALDTADVSDVGAAPEIWEKVVQKLRGGMMPPPRRPRRA